MLKNFDPRQGPRLGWKGTLFLLTFLALPAASCSLPSSSGAKKVVILGIDGLDPKLLQGFLKDGALPHFEQLMRQGDFRPLQTTMPPLSPVAWSTFVTGMDPGGHGIFDFIRRDPQTMFPEYAMNRTVQSDWNLDLGSWVIPLSGGRVEQLRQGKTFWQILDESGVPTTVFRIPVNFPPAAGGHSFSGMGTPDILGSQGGTFALYTDFPPANAREITGGTVYPVEVRRDRVQAQLHGPPNTFRRERKPGSRDQWLTPKLSTNFEVFLDPDQPVAKLVVEDTRFILQEGEWSDWVRIDFEALPYLASISATCRFYLQQVRPHFRLYVSPLQINPADPVMPISWPESWAPELQRHLGYFYTQELPEDTKAFSYGVFSGSEFWDQSQFVFRERRKALDYFLENFKEGLLFFYFSSVDQGCHMLWRYIDPRHPGFVRDERLAKGIRTLYQEMDEALGKIMAAIDAETTLIVMSDHGFSPFYRGINLNSWLLERGYVRLRDPTQRGLQPAFMNVDWTGTRAYAVGLNGLYVNLRGREKNGIVSPGADYQRLLDRLERDLLALKDPQTGQQVVTSVVQSRRDFKGDHLEDAPDIIVGYNYGYRSSWENPLGEFPREIFVDNKEAWSGDHSIDSRFVPGVLVTNQRITLPQPALADLTAAVLDEYKVAKLPEMIGRDCLAP
ncbi:MAG: alkaline phosphatase family protein, partial [Acidobacteriota bacterium]